MNVHISYKVRKSPDIEHEVNHLLDKLAPRLRAYRPELIHLKGLIEQNSAREGAAVSLNLRLPSGQMAARESGMNPLAALKAASDDLIQQLIKHKDLLRGSRKRHRRNGNGTSANQPSRRQLQESQSDENTAASSMTGGSDDIRSYVNANLGLLERFIEREIYFREISGRMISGTVTKDEIVDEVVVRALGDAGELQNLAIEPWLYRLAIQSINDLISRAAEEDRNLGSESANSTEPGYDTDPPMRSVEAITEPDLVADNRSTTPEDIAYSDEIVSMMQSALSEASESERDIFILHAIEGFSVVEIAAIMESKPEAIQLSLDAAREKLRKSSAIRDGLKEDGTKRKGVRNSGAA